MGLVAGVIGLIFRLNDMHLNDIPAAFNQGAADLLGAAMCVGMAQGIIIILGGTDASSGTVLNTILHSLSGAMQNFTPVVSAWLMYVFQSVINLIVVSGSGQAALTMPIMAPLADLVGVERQVAVVAYQLGDAFTNFIVPTSGCLLGALAAAKLDWGKWAKCRNLTIDEIEQKLADGKAFTLRLKSPGSPDKKCFFDDMIKGKIEMPENVQDIVLLKSDGIPTYHFAHANDDHLMRTTNEFRGDEWISSTPVHLQLFRVLGFKPPKYAHVAPIMKEENGGKRKLSKRIDPEAAVSYYIEQGFPQKSVNEYIMTIANSNFEDWRRANKTEPIEKFPFSLKKMSVSGALFDMVKLTDVSKNVISTMTAQTVYNKTLEWAEQYNERLAELFKANPEYAVNILNIDRENKKPRKDIAKWSDVKDYISYMYDETFIPCYDLTGNATPELAVKVLEKYINMFDINDDKDGWFSRMKDLCPLVGCTPNVKEYKQNTDVFKGHVGDVSTIIRVALTGRTNTPDLYYITALLGKDKVKNRIENSIEYYKTNNFGETK